VADAVPAPLAAQSDATRAAAVAGVSALALVLGCVIVAWLHRAPIVPLHGGHPRGSDRLGELFLVLLVAAFVAYLSGLALLRRSGGSFTAVWLLALAIQLAPLGAPLLLSTDAWTYWSYARVHDPYRDTPAADPVSAAHAGSAYLHETSAYGPAWTLAAESTALTRSADVAAWAFKVLAAACVLLTTWLVARRRAFAAALVGWNPLVAIHFGGGGHNDALMVALVAVALALGVLVKWVPLLLLPLRAVEARATGRRVDHLGFAATVVGILGLATLLWRFHWLHAVGPLAHDARRETRYAVPHRTHVPTWLFAAAYAGAYVWLLAQARRGRARLGLALALLLPALPYLIAWYVLWPLALAAREDDRTAWLLTLALCAYLLPQGIPT
jgi:hypothetical protein